MSESIEDARIRRSAILEGVATLFERAELVDESCVRGTFDGQVVEYLLFLHDDGEGAYTRVSSPAAPGFFLDVRPTTASDEEEVRKGLAVDHLVGDPKFDAAFIVEGAPERHVRAMFDDEARACLLAAQPATLRTEKGAFALVAGDWDGDMRRALAMLRVVARVSATATRLAQEAVREGGGYREAGALVEADAREVDAAVARSAERKNRREASRVLWLLLVVVVSLGGAMAYVALTH